MAGPYQSPWIAWVQLGLGATAMILAILGFSQANANRELQKAAGQNQARLTRANTFANLDNGLIQLMAKSAVENNDPALTALLAENGVTFKKPAAADPGARP